MAGKYDHIDFKPPQGVADAAARGLELRKKNKGKGGTEVGVQRAVNLKNRDSLSPSTVRRMKAFFDRHEKNKKIEKGKQPHEDRGFVSWLLWGGDPGRSWANKIIKQMEAADKKAKAASIWAAKHGLSVTAEEDDVEEQSQDYGPNAPDGDYADDDKGYQAFLKKKLKDTGHDSVKSLMQNSTQKEISEFWKSVDREYKSKREAGIKRLAHFVPNYEIPSSQAAQYDTGFSSILDLYRDKKISGVGDMSDRVKRISQQASRADTYAKKYGMHKDQMSGGLADKKKPSDFCPKQLAKGVRVELEHTDDLDIAKEIAMDHLAEDPKYYDKLETIEQHEHDRDYMARSNMSQIEDQSDELERFLEWAEENGERLEDWFEDKVSSVSDDMEELYNYVKHRKEAKKKDEWEPTDKDKWKKAQDWARRTYKVHPSAYSNLAASKKYKEMGGKWKKKKKKSQLQTPLSAKSNLREWLDEKWVDISRKDKSGKHPACGRGDSDKGGYPKCRPKSEADKMSAEEKRKATEQKRSEDNPKSGKGNKPARDSHKKRD